MALSAGDSAGMRRADAGRQQAAYHAGQSDAANMATRGQSHDGDENTRAAYDYGYDEAAQAQEGGSPPSTPAPAGVTPGPKTPESHQDPAPASASAPGGRRGGSRLLSGGADKAESGAGLVLGMIAYALVINYLRGGLPAVKGWFAAKFLNKAYQGPLPNASSYGTPGQPSSYATPAHPAPPLPSTPVGPPIGVPSVIQSQAGT